MQIYSNEKNVYIRQEFNSHLGRQEGHRYVDGLTGSPLHRLVTTLTRTTFLVEISYSSFEEGIARAWQLLKCRTSNTKELVWSHFQTSRIPISFPKPTCLLVGTKRHVGSGNEISGTLEGVKNMTRSDVFLTTLDRGVWKCGWTLPSVWYIFSIRTKTKGKTEKNS